MKAAVPPAFWASAIVCSMSVVFPDDSGPKISMTRPRGSPPVPSARSSPSEPDGMTGTSGGASVAPSFMMDPLPNCFSIWAIANAGQGQMRREGARLLRKPERRRAVLHSRLKPLQLRHVLALPVQSQPDHAGRARIRERAQPAGFQREGTGRRGRLQEDRAQGVHLRLLDVSPKLERQMDGLRLGPADLDGLTAPSRTGDLPFQLRLYASYLTLQGVGKLNGDERAQHFFLWAAALRPLSIHPRARGR